MLLRKLPAGQALYLLGKWAKFSTGLVCQDADPSVMSIIIRANGDLPDKILENQKLDYYPVGFSKSVTVNSQKGVYKRNLGVITDMIVGKNLMLKPSLVKRFHMLELHERAKIHGITLGGKNCNYNLSLDMLMLSTGIPVGQYDAERPFTPKQSTQKPKQKGKSNEIFRPVKAIIRSEKRKVHTIRSRRSKASIAIGHITYREISL